jgi:hypothetical protein
MKILLRYVNPTGELPLLVNTKQGKNLLVIGSASGVWDDLKKVNPDDYDLMGINHMMIHYPGRLDHGATLHSDHMPGFAFFQGYEASNKPCQMMMTHSNFKNEWVKTVWPIHRDGGTSGLFGVFIGLLMGYDKIVLAGCPCDDSRHFYDPPDFVYDAYARDTRLAEWTRANDEIFNGQVKSLSGRTKQLLGEPNI